MIELGNSWQQLLEPEFRKDYYLGLRRFLREEYANYNVYPDMYDIFNALKATAYEDVKAVILGQDPYHNRGQAHGMAFSVQKGVPCPPSLVNIYKELQTDLGTYIPQNGYLMSWAEQGVLLLNTILTVRENSPLSHKGKGWEVLTDRIISLLNAREKPIVFLLWGRPAREKKSLITNPTHFVLEAPHPSPLSAHYGFFGCKHFSKTNAILKQIGVQPIDWQIRD